MPWFHQNVLLHIGGFDDDGADDGTRPAGGENHGAAEFGPETSREMNAGPWTCLRRRVRVPALETKQGVRADRDDHVPADGVGRPAGGEQQDATDAPARHLHRCHLSSSTRPHSAHAGFLPERGLAR